MAHWTYSHLPHHLVPFNQMPQGKAEMFSTSSQLEISCWPWEYSSTASKECRETEHRGNTLRDTSTNDCVKTNCGSSESKHGFFLPDLEMRLPFLEKGSYSTHPKESQDVPSRNSCGVRETILPAGRSCSLKQYSKINLAHVCCVVTD